MNIELSPQYQEVSKGISVFAREENWGAAAKLASQISAQLRAARKFEQANMFGEISMYSTLRVAVQAQGDDPTSKLQSMFDNPLTSHDSVPRYTKEAREVLFDYQGRCGVDQTGRADWNTMSCLPGGKKFKLPTAVLSPLQF